MIGSRSNQSWMSKEAKGKRDAQHPMFRWNSEGLAQAMESRTLSSTREGCDTTLIAKPLIYFIDDHNLRHYYHKYPKIFLRNSTGIP